jgi:hypothetical protein
MSRRASGLIAAALVLVVIPGATAASVSKPVTPKLGIYYDQEVGPPEDGNVSVRETEVKVVRIGRRQGASVRVSPFPATCNGGFRGQPFGVSVLEKSPIQIKDGRFALDRTTHGPVAGGAGTATTRTVVSGTFKSATKVVVTVSVKSSISVQYSGQPEISGTCMGEQTSTAKHR